jgi:hypothetical protein
MRLIIIFAWLPFLLGCLIDGRPTTLESAVRLPIQDKIIGLIEKQLNRDSWRGAIVSRTDDGRVSTNPTDLWSESSIVLDVEAKREDSSSMVISTEDSVTVLNALRRRLRDLVEDNKGEQLDWTIHEAYRERRLVFRYKSGHVLGWIQIRLFPKSDRPEETLTRFEIIIHELPDPT